MSVMIVGVDRLTGAREAPCFVYAARDAEHDDAILLAEILRRGRRS